MNPIDYSFIESHIEAKIKGKQYKLLIDASLYYYQLFLDQVLTAEGSIPAFLQLNDTLHDDADLYDWMKLKFDQLNLKFSRSVEYIEHSFNVQNRSFKVFINKHSGEVKLHFPELLILVPRKQLIDIFPEIYGIENGVISDLLESIIAGEGVESNSDSLISETHVSFLSDQIQYHQTHGGLEFKLVFQKTTDLIYLNISDRTISTHLSSLLLDTPEIEFIQDGKYLDALFDILSKYE